MDPDNCRGSNDYYPPLALSQKDTDLLRELITVARRVQTDGYVGSGAMAALICGVLALDELTYMDAILRAIDGDEMHVEVTQVVTI